MTEPAANGNPDPDDRPDAERPVGDLEELNEDVQPMPERELMDAERRVKLPPDAAGDG